MNANINESKYCSSIVGVRSQSGAVLLVSLVLLLVMTLVGITNMRSSSMQFQMTKNNHERSIAFNAAEFVLTEVESAMQQAPQDHDPRQHVESVNCSGSICYDPDCSEGYCFEGVFAAGEEPAECVLGIQGEENLWTRNGGEIWDDAGKYRNDIAVPGFAENPRYIVEFLCYVDKNSHQDTPVICELGSQGGGCIPQYRVTVLAESDVTKARVMLQGVTKLNL